MLRDAADAFMYEESCQLRAAGLYERLEDNSMVF